MSSNFGFPRLYQANLKSDNISSFFSSLSFPTNGDVNQLIKATDLTATAPAGSAIIYGGGSLATSSGGAKITLGGATASAGGDLTLQAGDFGTNLGGVIMSEGNTATTGGSHNITAGNATTGSAGSIYLEGGDCASGSTSNISGAVRLIGSACTGAATTPCGSVRISSGVASGTGNGGNVVVNAVQASGSGAQGILDFQTRGVIYRWPANTSAPANGTQLSILSGGGTNGTAVLTWT